MGVASGYFHLTRNAIFGQNITVKHLRFPSALFFLAFFHTPVDLQAQFERTEIAAPLHPFTFVLRNYYLQYESYVNPRRSWIGTIGAKNDELLYLWFEHATYRGARADYGQRLYLNTPVKWFQVFGGLNLNLEAGKLKLEPYSLDIPKDSLELKGLMVGPELNFGGKITILQRVSIAGLAGYRHYFNSFKTENITFNPEFWEFNDWNNTSQSWIANRSFVEHFKKGGYPVIQINVAYVIGLRSNMIPPHTKTAQSPYTN